SSKKLTIITISSGAGRRAIPSWANYCASKAAVDLFSETLQEEAEELNIDLKVFSIAPGVVDTDMQQAIRNTTTSSFSQVEKYQKLFANGELLTPEFVAKKIIHAITRRENLDAVILRINEI